jgi:hypothetical protein
MNARTKTFNFPFRGTENHQAYVSTNVRKTLDTTGFEAAARRTERASRAAAYLPFGTAI